MRVHSHSDMPQVVAGGCKGLLQGVVVYILRMSRLDTCSDCVELHDLSKALGWLQTSGLTTQHVASVGLAEAGGMPPKLTLVSQPCFDTTGHYSGENHIPADVPWWRTPGSGKVGFATGAKDRSNYVLVFATGASLVANTDRFQRPHNTLPITPCPPLGKLSET